MSEKILKALMQLFAIIAKTDGVTSYGRNVVFLFLKQQLNQERVEEYLKLFDQFLAEQPEKKKIREGSERRASVKDSVRVLRICTQINSELEQKQKVVVLIRIMEFIGAGNAASEQELEFAATVAETFNISSEEFKNIKGFVLHGESEVFSSPDLLTIDTHPATNSDTKHIQSENLSGKAEVLKISSVDMYTVRYIGDSELNLNGQVMLKNQVYILTHGSSLRSPKIYPIYYSDIVSCYISDQAQAKIVFSTQEIEYVFRNGKKGLYPLSFSEDSGKMIGIMGASGAGKSTLLNILNGMDKPTKGKVLINGIDIHREKEKLEGVIGFVSQDDLLIEELSVYQNLFYNAKLSFGGMKEEEIRTRVDKLLEDIGLYEIRDLKVGNPLNKKISGGQRKRLNIGLELIREPSVLFVDEPTSGLSSRDSENIMDLLKELSLKGKLVFVVIHQPSSDIFKMFDKLLILDTGGFPIYLGNPVDSIVYFKKAINHVNCEESECMICGNVNPEQIFNIIESKVVDEYGNPTRERKISAKEWNIMMRQNPLISSTSSHSTTTGIPESTSHIPGIITQFSVFITRDVLSKLSNTQYMLINFLEAPLLAFILAFMVRYYNSNITESTPYILRENGNIPAYIFMSIVVALFMGLTVSAEEIIGDRRILRREQFLNLSRSGYLVSKVVILFVISAIQTLTYAMLGNMILGIHGMTLAYWMALFTTSCFANMLGLNISATFNSAVTIYILIPILLIPQLLLSGVIVKFDKLNPVIASEEYVPVAGEMMTSRWAFEALAVHQFMKNDFEKNFYEAEKSMSRAEFRKTYWIPNLREKIDFCEDQLMRKDNPEKFSYNLTVIQNELKKESKRFKSVDISFADKLTPALFNSVAAADVRKYLDQMFEIYVKIYNKYNNQNDALVSHMQETPFLQKQFAELKNNEENEALSDLVKNDKDLIRIAEQNGKLIQKIHPVFCDPDFVSSLDFRAHFFAPRKQFMGLYFDSFSVNMVVIWVMTLLLYITLYFESFRWVLGVFERVPGWFSKNN